MNAEEIIRYIGDAKKKTPVKVYLKGDFSQVEFPKDVKVFAEEHTVVLFGDWEVLAGFLTDHASSITDQVIENDCRYSAIPLLDLLAVNARIEPGAIIRDQVEIGSNAVVMMGAVINIGAKIGEGTMIDMNAVLGGRATVGKNCHVGAGAVLAGVIEPPSADPVTIEDNVLIGANAVILEGVRIGKGAVVAAGAIVVDDVAPLTVVAGVPARVIKTIDEKTKGKTNLMAALRKLNPDH